MVLDIFTREIPGIAHILFEEYLFECKEKSFAPYYKHLKNMGTVLLCKVTVRDSKMERKCNMSLVMCIMKYGILKHLQENMEASVLQTAVTPALVIILKHVITSFCLPVLSPPVYFLSPVGLHQIKQAVH